MKLLHACFALSVLSGIAGCTQQLPNDQKAKREPASITLFRKDQLPGAMHRHTLWVNDVEIGQIANGATKTFHFMPSEAKNIIYVEAYDPFTKNPKSNTVALDVPSGGHVDASVEVFINGTAFDLKLEAKVK